jgi:hypothetical protein
MRRARRKPCIGTFDYGITYAVTRFTLIVTSRSSQRTRISAVVP